ncbi:MAG: RNA-binding protein [Alphaproteobacteria bacterium]|nr:RNA-binding protein [Alphaproteobacteria bacterium]
MCDAAAEIISAAATGEIKQMIKPDTTRKCIVSGELRDKRELLRFTETPDGQVVPDLKRRLGGRGVYVVCAKKQLEKAVAANLFAKALKRKVKVDAALVDTVEEILKKQALRAVSLARKSGCLIWGLDKVLEALKKQKAEFLIEAGDENSDGRKKIVSHAEGIEIFSLFDADELDEELKHSNTAHAAVLKGSAAGLVRESFARLAAFRNN